MRTTRFHRDSALLAESCFGQVLGSTGLALHARVRCFAGIERETLQANLRKRNARAWRWCVNEVPAGGAMNHGASGACSSLPSWLEAVYPEKCMPARQPMHRANILCVLDNTLVSKNCLKPPPSNSTS